MTRLKTITAALALCMVGLFACAASGPNVGLGRNLEVGLSSRMGSGSHGAGVDTTRVLSRTTSYPNSAAIAAGYVTPADTSDVLNSADDGTTVKWGWINEADSTNVQCSASANADYINWTRPRWSSSLDDLNTGSFTDQRFMFLWFSANGLKHGHKVESAYIMFNEISGSSGIAAGQVISARLDTISKDYRIVASTSVGTGSNNDAGRFGATWQHVNKALSQTWEPPLGARDDAHDFGPASNTSLSAQDPATGFCYRLNVTDAVQQALDTPGFDLSRGLLFIVVGYNGGNTASVQFGAGNFAAGIGAGVNGCKGNPVFLATTTSRRGLRAWGGAKVPIVLTWDDNKDAHMDYYPKLAARGMKFTSMNSAAMFNANDSWDSLYAANSANIDIVHHGQNHLAGFGTLTGPDLNDEIEKADWYSGTYWTVPPDTAAITGFAFIQGTGNDYSMEAIKKIVANGYESARAVFVNVDPSTSPIGIVRYPAWDQATNIYAMATLGLSNIMASGGAPANRAFMWEELNDRVDQFYQLGARYAMILYAHGGAQDYVHPDSLGVFLDLVERHQGARLMNYYDMVNLRQNVAAFLDPATITTANGYLSAEQTSAARYDSLRTADSDDNMLKVWLSPAGDTSKSTPFAPSGLSAVPGDGAVALSWVSGGNLTNAWNVYRYFDNGDTTLIGTTGLTFFTDASAVNGSQHNYYVIGRNRHGTESPPSNSASATPGTILSIPRPAYYAMWFQDPGASLTSAQIDSLAQFDAIVTGPFAMEGATAEPAYTGLLAALRSRNPDIIVLQYAHPWVTRTDGEGGNRSPYKRMKEYADTGTAGADSLGYVCNAAGQIVRGSQYPKTRFINFMRAGAADSVAFIWAEAYEKISRMSDQYTGLFVDDVVLSPLMMVYDALASGDTSRGEDIFDADNDDTVFASDAQEKAALLAYHEAFMRALRSEFARRGLQNRLIVANSSLGRANEPSETAEDIFALLDGSMNEGWNRWVPGAAASDTTWTRVMAVGQLHTRAQTAPALVMWQSHIDTSLAYVSEPVALAVDGFVCAQNNYNQTWGKYGNKAIPAMVRRLPAPGTFESVAIQEGAGTDPDTLTATYSSMTARLMLGRNGAAAATDTFAVWPYLITKADGTILSRSAFWEVPGEEGDPPGIAQFGVVGNLDNQVIVYWGDDLYPSDFSHVNIYRGVHTDVDSLSLFISAPTPGVYGTDASWTDTTAANDSLYCYGVTMVDVNGNEGPLEDFDCAMPTDTTPPSAPTNLVAFGSPGQVAIGWSGVGAADLLRYRIYRSTLGSAFAQIDSTVAAQNWYLDTTAIAGQDYTYVVRALDDDGNLSGASNQATGSWATPEPDYPSGLIVYSNNPASGQALLNWVAPDPATGLTRYRIYREPTSAALADSITAEAAYDEGTTAATYTDLNATADSTFYYAVTALFDATESAASNVYAHTNPAPPSNERVSDGLLALWEFDGLSGTTVPDVAGVSPAMDLTLTSAANTTWTAYALRFDSGARLQTSGAATRINDSVKASNQITVEMWVKPSVASQSGAARLLSIALDGSTRNIVIGHGLEGGGASTSILARVRGETSFNSASGSLGTDLVHVAFVRGSDSTGRLYINGLPSTTGAMATNFSGWVSSYPLAIGNEVAGTDRPWLGEVHLAAVYGRGLTAQEIAHNYGVGVPAVHGAPGPSRPELTAAGGNGFIRLRWAAVPTAAKYRIYRRTQDTASTLLDSTTTAVVYDDTTAVEGVTYFYKAKAVNGTNVASPFSPEAAASWTTTTELSVDSVTGTVTHGEAIVIAGSGFGNKATAAPLIYDNLESGSFNAAWSWPYAENGTGLSVVNEGRGANSAKAAYHNFRNWDNHGHFTTANNSEGPWFAQYWFKLGANWDWGTLVAEGQAGANLNNVKVFRMADATSSTLQNFVMSAKTWEGSVDIGNEYVNGDFTRAGYAAGGFKQAWDDGEWHLFQFEYKDSDLGVANGVIRWWVDGALAFQSTSMMTRNGASAYKRPLILGFYNSVSDPFADDNDFWIDDAYVDTSWARVEIGNASTYAACTHREIQIPSVWTQASITATVNAGTLEAGTAYLYVIAPDGTVSDGLEITIE